MVDNASTDGSVDGLLRAHPGVRVVRSGGNLGYARAANLGIAATGAPVVAVLNPDTVLAPGVGAALTARFAAEADLGAAGPPAPQPGRQRLPVGPADPHRGRRRRPRPAVLRLARTTRSPAGTGRRRPIRPVPATSTGCRAPPSGSAGAPSTTSAAGTSATSCTWRTSTSAGASAGRAGGWPTSRPATVEHLLGVSTASRPVPDDRRAPPVAPALRLGPLHRPPAGAARPGGRLPRRPRCPGHGPPPFRRGHPRTARSDTPQRCNSVTLRSALREGR